MTTQPDAAMLALDDPAEWPSFGHRLDQNSMSRWESHVTVDGLRCATCALSLEALLAAIPGVEHAQASAASASARVVWNAATTRPSTWFRTCARAGYSLTPALGSRDFAHRQRVQRKALWRWLVATLCMMQVMMYALPAYIAEPGEMTPDIVQLLRWASWVLSLPVMMFACGPFFRQTVRDLRGRRIGMDLPVTLGIVITFAVSTAGTFDPRGQFGAEVYFDSLTMFVFFLLTGRWLESRVRARAAGAIDGLIDRLPDTIECCQPDGQFIRVPARRLKVGDTVRVLPGEAFPADGTVLQGEALVDESLMTGESRPVRRGPGAPVLAGSHNLTSAVTVRIDATGHDSRLGQITALIQRAALDKPRLAALADRIAKPFLIGVLVAAALSAVYWWPTDPRHALMTAVAVLIVTCPCALSLATPSAMLACVGSLARQGVMVVHLPAIEALARIDTVIFDKTGTLTRGVQRLERVTCAEFIEPRQAIQWAAMAASTSLHPVARALVAEASAVASPAADFAPKQGIVEAWHLAEAIEHAGAGIEARLVASDGSGRRKTLRLGSASFCGLRNSDGVSPERGTHLRDEHQWLASFSIAEDIRDDAADTIRQLQSLGVTVRILSGDRLNVVLRMGQRLGISDAQGEKTPEQKLTALRTLQAEGHHVAMVGDGLNDAPVIAHAHVSFAMGNAAPLAQSRADFIVTGETLRVLPDALRKSRQAVKVMRQNLAWALCYNALGIPLAIAGLMPPWLAGLGMAASSLLVVGNAARLAGHASAGVSAAGSALAAASVAALRSSSAGSSPTTGRPEIID